MIIMFNDIEGNLFFFIFIETYINLFKKKIK